MDRRTFVGYTASCSAHLAFVTAGLPSAKRRFLNSRLSGSIIGVEPWGRLEKIADGVWALISTPLEGDRTTLCNGGIIGGADGALVVESFATPEGAEWMARRARELTGHWPSHVVLTHFHGDHTNGVAGYRTADAAPRLLATDVTRNLVHRGDERRGGEVNPIRTAMLADVVVLDPTDPSSVDLGGRTVRIVPRSGHTPSDVTVELADPSVVLCGDLVWNRMFPNYRDAIPSRLSRDVRALVRERESTYVPGHGALASSTDLASYIEVIDAVEKAARRAFENGVAAAEAAKSFRLPESLGAWTMFSPRYYEVALAAWERELRDR